MNNSKYFLHLEFSNIIKSFLDKDSRGKRKINLVLLTNLIFLERLDTFV